MYEQYYFTEIKQQYEDILLLNFFLFSYRLLKRKKNTRSLEEKEELKEYKKNIKNILDKYSDEQNSIKFSGRTSYKLINNEKLKIIEKMHPEMKLFDQIASFISFFLFSKEKINISTLFKKEGSLLTRLRRINNKNSVFTNLRILAKELPKLTRLKIIVTKGPELKKLREYLRSFLLSKNACDSFILFIRLIDYENLRFVDGKKKFLLLNKYKPRRPLLGSPGLCFACVNLKNTKVGKKGYNPSCSIPSYIFQYHKKKCKNYCELISNTIQNRAYKFNRRISIISLLLSILAIIFSIILNL